MALYMFFHALPDQHLTFLSEHPETFQSYIEGKIPMARRTFLDKLFGREVEIDLLENWPTHALEGFSPEINDRHVRQCHYLLNGSHEKVAHSGCVFQTWFAPRHKTVALTIDGESFALLSDQVQDLKGRIEVAVGPVLTDRYREANDGQNLNQSDEQYLRDAFGEITAACNKALEQHAGLMWTAAG